MIDIAALKEQVSLERAFEFLGLEWPETSKRNPQIVCPLPDHDESHPSCTLYEDHFYCFGCNRGGDVIELVILVKGWDFIEAIQGLAEWAQLEPPKVYVRTMSEPSPRVLFKLVSDQAHADVLAWVRAQGLDGLQGEYIFWNYDETMRAERAKEISVEDATRELLTWRSLWKERLA